MLNISDSLNLGTLLPRPKRLQALCTPRMSRSRRYRQYVSPSHPRQKAKVYKRLCRILVPSNFQRKPTVSKTCAAGVTGLGWENEMAWPSRSGIESAPRNPIAHTANQRVVQPHRRNGRFSLTISQPTYMY